MHRYDQFGLQALISGRNHVHLLPLQQKRVSTPKDSLHLFYTAPAALYVQIKEPLPVNLPVMIFPNHMHLTRKKLSWTMSLQKLHNPSCNAMSNSLKKFFSVQ